MNIIMNILFFSILGVICVSFVLSDAPTSVMCVYGGSSGKYGPFVITDVPPRCDVIIYAISFFSVEPAEADKSAITALKSAGKIVYMIYTYQDGVDWSSIIGSDDPSCLDTHITPMLTYLKDNKIDGVILGFLDLQEGKIPDYASKINALVCKIKGGVPSIKVGLWLSGYDAPKYTDNKLFDFTVTNDNIDLYIIDTATAGTMCEPCTTENGGRTPITSTDPNVVTLEQICKSTSSSAMDQAKIFASFADLALKDNPDGDENKSYSDYCSRTDTSLWCVDSIELLYNQVKYSQAVFKGLVISNMENDDFNDSCKCGKFIVANTFIDAWQNKSMTCCEKIG